MDMQPPSDGSMSETYHRGRKPLLGAGIVAAAMLGYACLRWRPSRIEVRGGSMAPVLAPGDWALAVPLRQPHRGDVVVVEHPGRPGYEMVKRLVALPGDLVGERRMREDEYWVEGDLVLASTDSRHFGPVTREELRAKVVLIYWPKERRRRL